MAKKTLTLQIKPTADALQDFKDTFTKVAAGRRVQRREGVYFTSIEAARNLLTRNRVALLRAIRQLHPRSTYDLAQRVCGRPWVAVSETVGWRDRQRVPDVREL